MFAKDRKNLSATADKVSAEDRVVEALWQSWGFSNEGEWVAGAFAVALTALLVWYLIYSHRKEEYQKRFSKDIWETRYGTVMAIPLGRGALLSVDEIFLRPTLVGERIVLRTRAEVGEFKVEESCWMVLEAERHRYKPHTLVWNLVLIYPTTKDDWSERQLMWVGFANTMP